MRIYKSVIDTSTELCCGFFFSYMYNMHICHALYLIIFCNLAAMCGWDQAVELKKLLQVQEFQTFECVMDLLKNVLILYWEKMCIHIMVFSSYILILQLACLLDVQVATFQRVHVKGSKSFSKPNILKLTSILRLIIPNNPVIIVFTSRH